MWKDVEVSAISQTIRLPVRVQVHLILLVKWQEKVKSTQKFKVEKLKENKNLQDYIKTIDRNLRNHKNTELDHLLENLEKSY